MTDSSTPLSGNNRIGPKVLRLLIAALIIFGAVLVSKKLVSSKPEVTRRKPPAMSALVSVEKAQQVSTSITISVMGIVKPEKEVVLRGRVPGEVVATSENFIEGAFFMEGEELLRVDNVDYLLAMRQAEAKLSEANYEVLLEEGHQKVAHEEWKLMDRDDGASAQEKSLALREPHLMRVQAIRTAAEAALQKAILDLDRTAIKAPFNAVIVERKTELGSQVSGQSDLAVLTGTDKAWVRVNLPVDRIPRLDIPGSKARITLGNALRNGRVIKLLPDVDPKGQMARLLIEVEDPFNLTNQPDIPALLMGSLVRVELEGHILNEVYPIPREALQDGSTVWLATENNQLEIRRVTTAWVDATQAYVSEGLADGERYILSGLSAPVQGMPLKVEGQQAHE